MLYPVADIVSVPVAGGFVKYAFPSRFVGWVMPLYVTVPPTMLACVKLFPMCIPNWFEGKVPEVVPVVVVVVVPVVVVVVVPVPGSSQKLVVTPSVGLTVAKVFVTYPLADIVRVPEEGAFVKTVFPNWPVDWIIPA